MSKRVEALRKLMTKEGIDAYVIPSTDPHQSEYLPECWRRRAWISGFTGSAGDLVVTADKAGLWTDSRYFIQAPAQLEGSGIDLFKMGVADTPEMYAWTKEVLKEEAVVGVDPTLLSHGTAKRVKNLFGSKSIELRSIERNLVDEIWEDQPSFPLEKIEVWPAEFSGKSMAEKLNLVRNEMDAVGADVHVVTMLDAIAWLFNIRCTDVEFNPVVIAYALVTKGSAELFVKKEKVTPALQEHLAGLVGVHDYSKFGEYLFRISNGDDRVLLDNGSVSQWVVDCFGGDKKLIMKDSPITLAKAVKNKSELEGEKAAHVRDGVAMVKFLKWLEKSVPEGGVTELSAADKLTGFRSEQERFKGLSFGTISAYAEHGAIIHYEADEESNVELRPEGIYLVDSGGQYVDGTTDITRTVSLGEPTSDQRSKFTLVLKGHVDLASASFPEGTVGKQLDTIARAPLWKAGLNYGHGTGHGVGAYLNVHEGPHAISFYRCTGVALVPGMVSSNEPGYYQAGEFGIRIENLICVVADAEHSGGDFNFLKFEDLTLCPIDLKLVDAGLLDRDEIKYLNAYHKRVNETLGPLLNDDERAWLANATRPI